MAAADRDQLLPRQRKSTVTVIGRGLVRVNLPDPVTRRPLGHRDAAQSLGVGSEIPLVARRLCFDLAIRDLVEYAMWSRREGRPPWPWLSPPMASSIVQIDA